MLGGLASLGKEDGGFQAVKSELPDDPAALQVLIEDRH